MVGELEMWCYVHTTEHSRLILMCLMYRCILFLVFGSPVQTYLIRYRIELEIFCCGKMTCFKSISQMYDGVFNSVFSWYQTRNIQQLSNSLHIAIHVIAYRNIHVYCIALHSIAYSNLSHRIQWCIFSSDLRFLYFTHQNIEDVQTTADEMEMYAAVLRVFRKAFLRQETMKTFKMYDCLEVRTSSDVLLQLYSTWNIELF